MSDLEDPPSRCEADRFAPGQLGAWWHQGARSAFFRTPLWSGLQTSPGSLTLLVVLPYTLGILVERAYIAGDASFYWPALQYGWLTTAVTLWVCWVAARRWEPASDVFTPTAASLISMLYAQAFIIQLVLAVFFVPLARNGTWWGSMGRWVWWVSWLLPLMWVLLAQIKLLWQNGSQRRAPKFVALLVLTTVVALSHWFRPLGFWYPTGSASDEVADKPLELTQTILEQQPTLLAAELQALQAGRPGLVDVYTITYSPYADEDVFRRESAMVVDVMEKRFDAAGRTLQLVNSRNTVTQFAWATPLNLQRAIERVATLMNRDEDVLLIHLTSHGARNGVLATQLWPLTLDSLKPAELRGWLDAANIRYRIVSVSACYSGSWIPPLAEPGTLVMTAADADHTSYGCGKGSDLTFFGRAMFDEELRHTWSFEQAHAAARTLIEKREQEAKKNDGFSNPQIEVGAEIKPVLSRLAFEQAARVAR